MSTAVMNALDPHKASNTAAVPDPAAKTLIATARFANTADGYVQLAGFAFRWEQRRWAVEGCFGPRILLRACSAALRAAAAGT